jgi:hypothetical protein
MPPFWTLYWLGFLTLPLVVIFAFKTLGKDSGYQKSTDHYWSYKPAGHKVRDANKREVWEHQNPGRKWEDRQEGQKMGAAAFLIIIMLIFFFWLSGTLFSQPPTGVFRQLLVRVGGPLLGGLSAWLIFEIQKYIPDYKFKPLMVLHIAALTIAVVAIIISLVFAVIQKPLPLSHHLVWVPIGVTLLLPVLDRVADKAVRKSASKRYQKGVQSGHNLDDWLVEVIKMVSIEEINSNKLDSLEKIMEYAVYGLENGYYDYIFRNPDFFRKTEDLLLDIVKGNQLVINNQGTYDARMYIIQALQTCYFYAANKFPQYYVNPTIKKALMK